MTAKSMDEEQYYDLCQRVTSATEDVSKQVWEVVKMIRGINPNLASQLENGVTDLMIETMNKAFDVGFEFAAVPLS